MSESKTQTITIAPAYDKRSTDPNKNYGIHGCTMTFILQGEKGAVQFVVLTNWHLPHVSDELLARPRNPILGPVFQPMPADLGYHSPTPRYEGQTPMDGCTLLETCYYDGSTLNAEPVFDILLREGSAGVWAELERFYADIFENQDEAVTA